MVERILLATLPVLLVGGLVVLILRQQLERLRTEHLQAIRTQAVGSVLPLMVSAHERATLYLDRIRPENLLARHEPATVTARVLYDRVLDDIQTEFEHNTVQQLYLGDKAWQALLVARDTTLQLFVETAQGAPLDKLSGLEFAQAIQAKVKTQAESPIGVAVQLLRRDVQRLFLPK